jgi:hypothetical protein
VLAGRGACDLVADEETRDLLASVLMELLVEPIESDFLQVHPVAVATQIIGGVIRVRLEVRQR